MPTANLSALVRRYFSAYETKDRQIIEDLLSDGFTFTSPLDDRIDRTAYFDRCWPNNEKIRAFTIESLSEKGTEVFVRYLLELQDGTRFRNTEFFRFEKSRIAEVSVYFGSLAENGADSEADIRKLIDDRARAIRDKDTGRIMANYASDILSYDVINPLQIAGSDAVRKRLEAWFASYEGPIGCEFRDLVVAARDDVAFAYSLHRFTGTMTNGKSIDMWVRDTLCFRKIDGRWRIGHEHMSDPFDPDSGQASLGLKPYPQIISEERTGR